jgi:hypothetical protein
MHGENTNTLQNIRPHNFNILQSIYLYNKSDNEIN